jgi:hypothetical protein
MTIWFNPVGNVVMQASLTNYLCRPNKPNCHHWSHFRERVKKLIGAAGWTTSEDVNSGRNKDVT